MTEQQINDLLEGLEKLPWELAGDYDSSSYLVARGLNKISFYIHHPNKVLICYRYLADGTSIVSFTSPKFLGWSRHFFDKKAGELEPHLLRDCLDTFA